MSSLHDALDQYVAMRRSLGFTFREPALLLRSFVEFVDRSGSMVITTDLALQWATQPTGVEPATWTWRLDTARRFAAWHQARDPRTEVPPSGLLAARYRRKPPHLYSDEEVEALMRTASALPSAKRLRGHTYATLFGLLAVTGMRLNEALRLNRGDVDLTEGVLVVRGTKFGKSRLVPVHRSTLDALHAYADARDRSLPGLLTPAFFVSERGTRITPSSTHRTFVHVAITLGLRPAARGPRRIRVPRLHDLRQHADSPIMPTLYQMQRLEGLGPCFDSA